MVIHDTFVPAQREKPLKWQPNAVPKNIQKKVGDIVCKSGEFGFLPEEREWMSQFINLGFIDIFRKNNSSPHNYTWWSYRALAKQRNKGWRIDYFMISSDLEKRVSCSSILSDINFSDHCPISLVLQNKS